MKIWKSLINSKKLRIIKSHKNNRKNMDDNIRIIIYYGLKDAKVGYYNRIKIYFIANYDILNKIEPNCFTRKGE